MKGAFTLEFEGHKQLNDFSEAAGRHHTTINNWFNFLEQRRIHYVNRTIGPKKERIFDVLDYRIAKYIAAKREDKWSMDAIYDQLPKEEMIELRPFPPDFEGETNNQLALLEQLRYKFSEEIRQELSLALDQIKSDLTTLLPPPEDPAVERDRYVTRWLTEQRIEGRLEEEAIEAWNNLPVSERTRKKGLLGREEDPIKRQDFIRQYVRKHKPARFMAEYGLEDKQ